MNTHTLDRVTAEYFTPLIGTAGFLLLPSGAQMAVVIDSVRMAPLSRRSDVPAEHRIPFSVFLTAVDPGTFVDGLCEMDCASGRLKELFVSRVTPAGRDPACGYYQVIFN